MARGLSGQRVAAAPSGSFRDVDEKDPSILGNLPRSRPGTRSAKRAREVRSEAAAERPRTTPRQKATPPRQRKPRVAPDAAKAADVREPQAARPEPAAAGGGPQDVVIGAVKAAGQVASAGVQIGTGVAREVLRRLPGPW
jgi:hypothetical protein